MCKLIDATHKSMATMLSHEKRKVLLRLLFLVVVLKAYNSCRQRTYLTRSGLLTPASSPWQRLLEYGEEQSFLLLTGMTRAAFMRLKDIVFEGCCRATRGRPVLLDESGQLGLFLMYIGSKMASKHLCLIFGKNGNPDSGRRGQPRGPHIFRWAS